MAKPHHSGLYRKLAPLVVARADADPSTCCLTCGQRARPGDPWQAGHVVDGKIVTSLDLAAEHRTGASVVPCLTCGIPCKGPRCPAHQHKYGRPHDRAALTWQHRVDAGLVVCPRCHKLIEPGTERGRSGDVWDLDHRPDGSLHPAHASCNRSHRTR